MRFPKSAGSKLTSILVLISGSCSAPALAQEATRLPPGLTTDPEQVRLETADLRRLGRALRAVAEIGADDTPKIIEREYLAQASPGLRAWAARDELTARSMTNAIRAHPAAYADPDALALAVLDQEPSLRAGFRELQELFPRAAFPPIWFFAGDHEAGALARPEGVLVAVERFAERPEDIVPLVLHELAHFQSAMIQGTDVYRRIFGPGQTLLALALREGSAEFIAELTTGRHTNPAAERYGLAHERELWARFREEMHRREPGDWMFVRPENPDQPPDLGYWIGYRIVRSYYDRAEDKRQAIHDILSLTDFEAFLTASGYAERMEP